jgi:hypothetical protein
MAPVHSKLKPTLKRACKMSAKRTIASIFVNNKYHLTEEQRLRRKNTILENQAQIAYAVDTFFSIHYAGHALNGRLSTNDPDYQINRRDYFKDLASHYWTNFDNVTYTSSNKMIHRIETTLLCGEDGLLDEHIDFFYDKDIATA